MKLTRIYAENYKTYKRLDLDLHVSDERPIILIGGGNGCGKTTLFDAIYHALYGLTVKTPRQFEELFNAGERVASGMAGKQIVLQVDFTGRVLVNEVKYQLRRAYMMQGDRVLESVTLCMGGNKYTYGTGTPQRERSTNEEVVNKIIAANLPSELSNYFLFDAMKTSDLLKEEQINKLIEKNINSVMGFSKYHQLRRAAQQLLEEKKAERLENENQRKEYAKLTRERQLAAQRLTQLSGDYQAALTYANDNKEAYDQLLQGRNADETTRDRMRQVEASISNHEKAVAAYRAEADAMVKELETRVVMPRLAEAIRQEVELIIAKKQEAAKTGKKAWSEEQLEELTRRIVAIIKTGNPRLGYVDCGSIAHVLHQEDEEEAVADEYSYLSAVDMETLSHIVDDAYANPFPSLDERRLRLDIEQESQGQRRQQLADLQRAVSGHDYTLMEAYEANNKRIADLKQEMETLKKQQADLDKRIARYDYDMPQVPDPQYDMLCHLPSFFQHIATRLLREKKANIERMMREQLNINLVVYAGVIGRVELSAEGSDDIAFKIYHKNGNEIYLNQLNAGAKQTVMQVLLKVLYTQGDYEPPVMIDTVMGVLDKESREVILERYFPDLAHQTILLSTDTEITTEADFKKLSAYVARTYTLHRDKEAQQTSISSDYFGLQPQDN